MKKLLFAVLFIIVMQVVSAQSNWRLSGNSGTSSDDFLGTTDNRPLVFKTNDTERGRLLTGGAWRFGSSADHTKIDINGNLTFNGTASYLVDGNSYVFRYLANPNYSLYFNSTLPRYEFRNGSSLPVFYVNANNGNGVFNGTLKVGTYTLPSADGLGGQVLKTNGSGLLAWSNDLTGAGAGANLFLSNLGSPTAVNQSLLPDAANTRDIGSAAFTWKDIYANGALYLNGQKFLSNPGNRNIPIGNLALNSITTGSGNIALGEEALTSNTTGEWNIATGFQALYSNTTSNYNNAYGFQALQLNTGSGNDAFGTQALRFNTTGGSNTAFGGSALFYNTSGYINVGVGVQALFHNTTGGYNVGIGLNSGALNTEGWYNTAIGPFSLYSNVTGYSNTAIGGGALTNNGNGSSNTALGVGADVTAPNLVNATTIGVNALVDASDKVRIGNTNVTSIGGEVSWTTFSDVRYKRNIKENVPGIEFINSLRPITYTVDVNELNNYYNKNRKPIEGMADAKTTELFNRSSDQASKIIYTGFAAQEVEAAANKLNFEFSGVDKPKSSSGLYGLRYDQFVVPLVRAVQEISKTNEAKDEMIDAQQKQIDAQQLQIDELKKQVQQLAEIYSKKPTVQIEKVSVAVLEQNVPNPFSQATSIRYQLPPNFSSAQMVITDKTGNVLKQINIPVAGKGILNIDASTMTAGAYQYSFYVDGKLIATKQMILTK